MTEISFWWWSEDHHLSRDEFLKDLERNVADRDVIIDDEGRILTNYHVIEGAQKLSVSFGGDKVYPATRVGEDPDTNRPFDSPRALFRAYLARNVPSSEEALLTFVGGEQYEADTEQFPLEEFPPERLAEWEGLSEPSGGISDVTTARYATELGDVNYKAARVRLGLFSPSVVLGVAAHAGDRYPVRSLLREHDGVEPQCPQVGCRDGPVRRQPHVRAVVASLIPARRAWRLSVREVLAYE